MYVTVPFDDDVQQIKALKAARIKISPAEANYWVNVSKVHSECLNIDVS